MVSGDRGEDNLLVLPLLMENRGGFFSGATTEASSWDGDRCKGFHFGVMLSMLSSLLSSRP